MYLDFEGSSKQDLAVSGGSSLFAGTYTLDLHASSMTMRTVSRDVTKCGRLETLVRVYSTVGGVGPCDAA